MSIKLDNVLQVLDTVFSKHLLSYVVNLIIVMMIMLIMFFIG